VSEGNVSGGNVSGASTTLDILKAAILLERRGKAFYESVAEKAQGEAVQEFFTMMAKEEEEHVRQLSEQYVAYQKDGKFGTAEYTSAEVDKHEAATRVLSEKTEATDLGSELRSGRDRCGAADGKTGDRVIRRTREDGRGSRRARPLQVALDVGRWPSRFSQRDRPRADRKGLGRQLVLAAVSSAFRGALGGEQALR
jgi:rubrerythrin